MSIRARLLGLCAMLVLLVTGALMALMGRAQSAMQIKADAVRESVEALGDRLDHDLESQMLNTLRNMALTQWRMCDAAESGAQRELRHNLNLAKEEIRRLGGLRLGPDTVAWDAVNQLTREKIPITLPQVRLGDAPLAPGGLGGSEAPVVEFVRHTTRDFCTVFQRMNDAGDMLRVSTSVLGDDGRPAVGTYIPRRNPDGSENPVLSVVLQGNTYVGRAFVVNDWHSTVYEPIRSAEGRIIGMLYVGRSLGATMQMVCEVMRKTVVGRTGYIWVLGGHGDHRGVYIVSKDGEREGESLWESRDEAGRPFIQEMIAAALTTRKGESVIQRYPWMNPGETEPRTKIAACTYYEPLDWVIGVSTYEDEFMEVVAPARDTAANALGAVDGMLSDVRGLIGWVVGLGVGIAAAGVGVSILFARQLSKPLIALADRVDAFQIGRTEFTVTEERRDEIGVLEQSFAVLSRSLNEAYNRVVAGEKKLQSIFRAAPAGIGLAVNHAIAEANDRLADMTGYSREELRGLPARRLYDSDEEYERVDQTPAMRAALQGAGGAIETRWRRKDGTCMDVLLGVAPLDVSDLAQGITFTALDITARRRAEQTMQRSEAKYRELVENANSIIIKLDAHGNFTFFNEFAQRLFGFSEAEILGRHLVGTIVPSTESSGRNLAAMMQRICNNPERFREHDNENITKDGRRLWVHWTNKAIRNERGELTGMLSIGNDITERKRAEDALAQTQALLWAAFEQTASGILVADAPDVRLRMANSAALALHGEPAAAAGTSAQLPNIASQLYRSDGSVLPLEESPLHRAVRQGETSRNVEVIIRRPNGENRWTLVNAAPVRNAHGRIVAGIAVISDITDRKQAEAERNRLEEQLRQAQKMEAVGQLAGGVAHDFNNLLQAVNGYTEMALMELAADHPARASMTEVAKAGARAAEVVRQLLAFSRRQVIKTEDLDLNGILPNLLTMLGRVIGEHIRLAFTPGRQLRTVRADKGMIEQVVTNLCLNARDAMPGGGDLTLATENVVFDEAFCENNAWARPGAHVLLTVADTGCGMDAETLSHIFEPFFTTKEVGAGSGLGLAMVYGIIQQHQGMIQVSSEPGKGTTFKVYLPAVESAAAAPTPVAERRVTGGPETLLLAEDDDQVRDLAKRVLTGAGYTVHVARSGEEALEVFAAHAETIRMVILDVVMPRMGGREVYDIIRKRKPGIPALFASGYSVNAVHTNFVLKQGLELIQKPYSITELLDRIREILDRCPANGRTTSA